MKSLVLSTPLEQSGKLQEINVTPDEAALIRESSWL